MAFSAGEHWTCGPAQAGWRLDRYLSEMAPETSRSRVQKWIEEGRFSVNGDPARKSTRLEAGDAVTVLSAPAPEDSSLQAEDIPLRIVYEDDSLVVVDKPKGMVTHPGSGVFSGTLANALAFRFRALSDVNGPMRPGLLHRLDKDTSGLLLVAKDNAAHLALARQLEARDIKRVYQALVWRQPPASGVIDLPIARSPRDPLKMAVVPDGKRAVTHYRVLAYYQFASLLEVSLETGRTHQIRVHLAQAGHPVAGDPVYGGGRAFLGRIQPLWQPMATRLLAGLTSQALHAHRLAFAHPATGAALQFESPLPEEMRVALGFLEQYRQT